VAASGLLPVPDVVACPAAAGALPSMGCGRSACPGSGFTLLFEALVLSFAAAMPMAKVTQMTREPDTRIWRVVEHHVHAARDQLNCSGVCRVGMEETSAAKGQDYVSIFADLDARRVVFATAVRSAETVAGFAANLAEHGGDPEKVTDTSSEMSSAFISGIRAHLPNARMTFDRYHLAAKLSGAIDTVPARRSRPARSSSTPAGCG
jgi:transposase